MTEIELYKFKPGDSVKCSNPRISINKIGTFLNLRLEGFNRNEWDDVIYGARMECDGPVALIGSEGKQELWRASLLDFTIKVQCLSCGIERTIGLTDWRNHVLGEKVDFSYIRKGCLLCP